MCIAPCGRKRGVWVSRARSRVQGRTKARAAVTEDTDPQGGGVECGDRKARHGWAHLSIG